MGWNHYTGGSMSYEQTTFGAGCFWGVEYVFRRVPGVVDVSVGYSGGFTENPTYPEVCSHTTGHAEAAQGTFARPIATEIRPLTVFYPAEGYHQAYYEKNGHTPYCHVVPTGVLEQLGLIPARG